MLVLPRPATTDGWKAIAAAIGAAPRTAKRLARRERDPLPAWRYLDTVVAWPSAIREWQARQLRPVSLDRVSLVSTPDHGPQQSSTIPRVGPDPS